MRKPTFQEQQFQFLKTIYDLAGGIAYKSVDINKVTSSFALEGQQIIAIMVQLDTRKLADFPFGSATITPNGIEEVEKLMEKTYAEQERFVLKTIYEMGKNRSYNEVPYKDLIKQVGLGIQELNAILIELEKNKGYLMPSSDECIKVSPRGMEFLQGQSNMKDNRNIHNITNIHAPVGNLQQFTHNSSQSFTQIHAPSSVPDDLLGQIALLREELKKIARAEEEAGHDTSDYDEAIGSVTSARKALTDGDESKAKSYLLSGGKFIADFASKIGVNLVTEMIKQQTGT